MNERLKNRTPKQFATKFLDSEGNPEIHLTKQSDMDSVDINKIMARYDKTGLITHVNSSVAQYGDFTSVNEYQDALNRVIQANADFEAIPSAIRAQFNNDPGQFFEFATDPKNHEDLVKLGLANPKTQAELPKEQSST